jgi:hypothetical protein
MTNPKPVHDLHETFLRQTIFHSTGMTMDPRNLMGLHADASINAWWAHRLLTALAEAIPDQLPALIADISEQLEMGHAHEASFEDATAIGLDVDELVRHAEAKFAELGQAIRLAGRN